MDDDPYGFASDLDTGAAKVLDKAGLAEFVRQVEARFDAAATAEPIRRNPENRRRVWCAALRTLYLAQKNLEAYVALTQGTGGRRRTATPSRRCWSRAESRRKPWPGSSAGSTSTRRPLRGPWRATISPG
jgi:hypothetical protein